MFTLFKFLVVVAEIVLFRSYIEYLIELDSKMPNPQPNNEAMVKWEPTRNFRTHDDPEALREYNLMARFYDELVKDPETTDAVWMRHLPIFRHLDNIVKDRFRQDRRYESLEDLAICNIRDRKLVHAYRSAC